MGWRLCLRPGIHWQRSAGFRIETIEKGCVMLFQERNQCSGLRNEGASLRTHWHRFPMRNTISETTVLAPDRSRPTTAHEYQTHIPTMRLYLTHAISTMQPAMKARSALVTRPCVFLCTEPSLFSTSFNTRDILCSSSIHPEHTASSNAQTAHQSMPFLGSSARPSFHRSRPINLIPCSAASDTSQQSVTNGPGTNGNMKFWIQLLTGLSFAGFIMRYVSPAENIC